MKKFVYTFLALLLCSSVYGQTNTFPSSGNVGIGTTSPGSSLTVEGIIRSQITSSNFVYNFFVSGDGNSYMNYVGGSESSRIGFQMDGASKASIYKNGNFVVHSGNVGIGTNSPFYNLHVNGTIGLNNTLWINRYGIGDYSSIELRADIGAYIDFTQGTNDFDGRIAWNLGENGRFNIYGDVKFIDEIIDDVTIDGILTAEEVRVQNVPHSDYVFEPEYNLLPLNEVEAFIKENKHLPEIPSAEEFKENGVGLGEMDDMLLRKVEELMLYVIELKKENEELKDENNSKDQRISTQTEQIKLLNEKVDAIIGQLNIQER